MNKMEINKGGYSMKNKIIEYALKNPNVVEYDPKDKCFYLDFSFNSVSSVIIRNLIEKHFEIVCSMAFWKCNTIYVK